MTLFPRWPKLYDMEQIPEITDDYRPYADYWSAGLQKIDEIHKDLDLSIREIEKLYPEFEEKYRKAGNLADILSSIYAGVNALDGRDDLLKLKSFIDRYKKLYTREGIDFETIGFLLDKIGELRSKSFENFPVLHHNETSAEIKEPALAKDYLSWPYRWFTFRRGWSWFMVPFNDLDIYRAGEDACVKRSGPDSITVEILGRERIFLDLFSLCRKKQEPSGIFITIDGKSSFAVSRPGKKIFSRFDFISPRINKYAGDRSFPLSPGRVRLFGISHVYLDAGYLQDSASSICAGAYTAQTHTVE